MGPPKSDTCYSSDGRPLLLEPVIKKTRSDETQCTVHITCPERLIMSTQQFEVETLHFADGFPNTSNRDVEPQLRFRESSSGSSSPPPAKEGMGTEEQLVVGGEEEKGRSESTNCVSYGSVSVMGRRRVMEDAVTVAAVPVARSGGGPYDFFAVYDGHGGSEVAVLCRNRLHKLLSSEMEAWASRGGMEIDWRKVMEACFSKIDEEVGGRGSRAGCLARWAAETSAGSTAVVVVVGREELVVANCGDCRVVLCRDGGVAVPLSSDHKPDRPDERERVEAAGGSIINRKGSRVSGVLPISRSIGDHYLMPYVIPEPEVTVTKRTESDNFLIIASDGLWDVVSNEMACHVVKRSLDGRITERTSRARDAATVLVELAMAQGSRDNISVIVVELNKSELQHHTTQS